MSKIEVNYPDGFHVPSKSSVSYIGIISDRSNIWGKFTLTEVVNRIFEEKHEEIFGANKYLIANKPESVLIVIS